jgi:hypothetical protein
VAKKFACIFNATLYDGSIAIAALVISASLRMAGLLE